MSTLPKKKKKYLNMLFFSFFFLTTWRVWHHKPQILTFKNMSHIGFQIGYFQFNYYFLFYLFYHNLKLF